MTSIPVENFAGWRTAARKLLAEDIPPDEVTWSPGLFDQPLESRSATPATTVPKDFLELARTVAMHSDERRWHLLYRVLYRIAHGERNLLKIDVDEDVRELNLMAKAVSRDMHKMKAFVRFRRVEGSSPEQFVAWHKPDHHIIEALAPWFADRFGGMHWSILTPGRSAHWDLESLTFGPGVPRSEAPGEDKLEDLWRDYYASI